MKTTTPPISVLRTRTHLPAPRPPDRREPRCAYCHANLGGGAFHCDGCRTQLHYECKRLLSHCPTLGCVAVWSRDPSPPRGLNCARCERGFALGGRPRRACVLCGLQYHWRCRYKQARCQCGSSEFRTLACSAPKPPGRLRRFFRIDLALGALLAVFGVLGVYGSSMEFTVDLPAHAEVKAWAGEIRFEEERRSCLQVDVVCPGDHSTEQLMSFARELQREPGDPSLAMAGHLREDGLRALGAMAKELALDPWIVRVDLHPFAEDLAQRHAVVVDEHEELAALWAVRTSDLPDLLAAQDSSNTDLRVRARRAIVGLGAAAVPSLVDRLERDGLDVAPLLADIGEPSIPALRASLFEHKVPSAVYVLEDIGQPAVPALVEGLVIGDSAVRLACITSLARLRKDARPALPALRWLSETSLDVGVRTAAREAQWSIESDSPFWEGR